MFAPSGHLLQPTRTRERDSEDNRYHPYTQAMEPDTLACQKAERTSRPRSPNSLLAREETGPLLERICSEVSDATGADFVHVANSQEAESKLRDLLPTYFHTWQLQSPESVIVLLLLHHFVLKRDCDELKRGRQDYQDHIESLKEKIGQLEERIAGDVPLGGSANSEGLQRQLKEAKSDCQRLKDERDRLYHINQQWARDYETLTQQIAANPSGLISSSASSVSSSSVFPVPVCVQCRALEQQLDTSQRDLEESRETVKKLRREMQDKLKRKDLEIRQLDSENHAIHMQLQELGDLQTALKMKEDYTHLQHKFAQTTKKYQDVLSEQLQLQKQIEKLRQAFLAVFPLSANTRERTSTGIGVGAYNTVPKAAKTCRHHQHQYLSEPLPPTPPGLIARGEHRGSLVEKDIKPHRFQADEQVTGFEKPQLRVEEPHTWPGIVVEQGSGRRPRPKSLLPSDGIHCPSCKKSYGFGMEDFEKWFEHVRFCSSGDNSA